MSDFDSTGAMDEDEQMDLALNSDLCSVFLDCWDDTAKPLAKQNGSTGSRTPSTGEQQQSWETSMTMEKGDFQPPEADPTKKAEITAGHQSAADSQTCQLNPSDTSNRATTTESSPTKLHPQAIQSSADCPPHVAALNVGNSSAASTNNSTILPFPLSALGNPMFLQQSNAMNLLGASSHGATSLPSGQTSTLKPSPQPPPSVSGSEETSGDQKPQATTESNVPPFFLFDAPLELRANFIHAQRAHGMPVLQDNNSYHYGMAVNGFHPSTMNLRLVDRRHGGSGNKREKNAKEQKRARQITKLIEQLRLKMEKDGWHVEFKSKFHTLASCSDYVKHLIKVNKEKEAAIEQAKQDLEAKRQRLEEDKAQQDPSDPESTTSDLTESSDSAGAAGEKSTTETTSQSSDDATNKTGEKTKSRRIVSHESTVSSGTFDSTDDKGQSRPSVNSVPANMTSSSISDVTDSNKETSSKGNKDFQTTESTSTPTAPSAESTKEESHADVVIKGEKKRTAELDYEEVFLRSNVPQVLATTAGRIVSWNDIFLRATGLSSTQMKRLTIFSLVQPQHLASLFEIVAASLRTRSEGKKGAQSTAEDTNFSAITLPCVTFCRPGGRKPLFLTVTLMDDEDDRKRCFHCVLTDSPGTNGHMGSITPELLSELFRAPLEDTGKPSSVAPPTKKHKHSEQ